MNQDTVWSLITAAALGTGAVLLTVALWRERRENVAGREPDYFYATPPSAIAGRPDAFTEDIQRFDSACAGMDTAVDAMNVAIAAADFQPNQSDTTCYSAVDSLSTDPAPCGNSVGGAPLNSMGFNTCGGDQ